MTFFEVRDLVSYYGKVEVVSHVSIYADRGETVALLGRNGAGKSALMRSIMGLVPPRHHSGRVRLEGVDVTGRPTYVIARMGISLAPDDHRIFPHLSVEENLILAQRLTDRSREARSLRDVYDMFPLVQDLRGRSGGVLSGGEKKLVAIA